MKKIDLDTWSRRDHFQFFKSFEEPFFGVCVSVDCDRAYAVAKERGCSFFLYYLYQSLAAANAVEPFRYRIEGESVVVHERVNASPTIHRPDGTFGFSYMDFYPDFEQFLSAAQMEVERVQKGTGLELTQSNHNIIHYSSLPWLHFTGLSHARAFSFKDCIPKISFGKMVEAQGKKNMPVSIHVHHALMDGYHVGQFVEIFQELLNQR